MTSKNRGITIIELLAVVTILGILAAIVTPVAQVVITRELELDLMRHLRGVRRGIDNSHEIAVRCWVDNVVNRKDSDRCRQCNNLLTAVLCPNPLHVNQSERWNARSLIRCNNAISAPPGPCLDPDGQGGYRLDNILCPVCNQKIPAFDSSTGEPIVRCTAIDPNTGSICGGVVEKYQNYPLTNYPTAFQDMYILNTLRF
ncbi:MAG: type II secretion system protein, partial [bacterium]|nr:type II secretion system protein [bacterium]